ncbi:hypothetical protein MUK42_08944 [Musa troglodytarum]|uniref:Uncharacterized protein n=1 Tax=Musa troglodytarum TaxID=320322 RepID=A0A9E7E7M0_9LILI|nr:hypothetical protein MUK42_08944 [Musa troglodytarum]
MSPVTATTLTAVPAPRIAELITPLDADFPNPTLLGLRRASRRLRRTIALVPPTTLLGEQEDESITNKTLMQGAEDDDMVLDN